MPRTVAFWRAHVGRDEDGDHKKWDREAVGRGLAEINWPDRELYEIPKTEQCLLSVSSRSHNTRITFAKVSPNFDFALEQGGTLEAPEKDKRPAHLARWVLLPSNIVGVVRTQPSPTVQQVQAFLREVLPKHCRDLTFTPLLRDDAVETFERLSRLTSTRFIFDKSALHEDHSKKSFSSAAREAAILSGADEIEVRVRVRGRKGRLQRQVRRSVSRLLGKRNPIADVVVTGVDEEGVSHKLTFGKDRHSYPIEVTDDTWALDHSPLYSEIIRNYHENEDSLVRAAGLLAEE